MGVMREKLECHKLNSDHEKKKKRSTVELKFQENKTTVR